MRGNHLISRGLAMAVIALACNASAQDRDAAPRSTSTGRWISIVSTVVPTAIGVPLIIDGENANDGGTSMLGDGLVTLGMVLGPGAGHIYAGDPDRFGDGALVRFGIILGATALGLMLSPPDSDDPNYDPGDGGMYALAAGAAALLTYSVFDVMSVEDSVAAYNAQHAGPTVSMAAYPDPNSRSLGVCVAIRW
jgi:hypothetical protein